VTDTFVSSSPGASLRLEQIVADFESAWRHGSRPAIDAFLPATEAVRRAVLVELIHSDLEYRLQAGEDVAVEEYLRRYPELTADRPAVVELIVAEYRQRRRRPEVTFEDYLRRFPGYREDLLLRLQRLATTPERSPAPVPDQALPVIAGYEVLAELGRGGMGVVYQALHLQLKRPAAIKMILAGTHAGAEELTRFRIEAEAAARLRHPNIIQIYEVGEWRSGEGGPAVPFLALEYAEGGSLARHLAGTPRPAREAAALVETLARAIHHAHQQGIIHRDLKPGNVLLAVSRSDKQGCLSLGPADKQDACRYEPKVTDFGLAKFLDGGQTAGTGTDAILGTPSYMAPEQAAGRSKEIGPAADVYALGAILYECLTGRPPFRGTTPLETLDQVRLQEAVPPRQLQPSCPRDLDTICLKCLRKEPARRYATALDLAEDLHRYLDGRPISARPVGRLERGWRWCRRNPVVALLVAGVILSVLGGLAGSLFYAFAEQATAAREREQRVRNQRLLAGSVLDQGQQRCEQGDLGPGLLLFAGGLKQAEEASAADLADAFRLELAAWGRRFTPLRAVLPHPQPVHQALFSPDGRRVLTISTDRHARFWDPATGQLIGAAVPDPYLIGPAGFSPDGKTAVLGAADGQVQLWDPATAQPIGEILRHRGAVHAAIFSPDGKKVLTGGDDRTARLWDAATSKPVGQPLLHDGPVIRAAFAPDGATFLTVSGHPVQGPWKVQLWDVDGKQIAPAFPGEGVNGVVAFSPDLKRALTATKKRFLDTTSETQLWDAARGEPLGKPLPAEGVVNAAAFSPDGQRVLTANLNTARLWNAGTGQPIGPPLVHSRSLAPLTWAPDGRTVLTEGSDGRARLWDAATGKPIGQELSGHLSIRARAFSPDSRFLATGGTDGTVRLWDVSTGQLAGEPLSHVGELSAVAFSPDSRLLLTATSNSTFTPAEARLWEMAGGDMLDAPLQHQQPVRAAAFSPDGKLVATGSADKTARVWDAETGQPLSPSLKQGDEVWTVAFSPDGKTLLTGSTNTLSGSSELWLRELPEGKPLGQPFRDRAGLLAAVFSPDGRSLLTGWDKGGARLWDLKGRQIVAPLPQPGFVSSVAFSPDGKVILTRSGDKAARLWDASMGRLIGKPLEHGGGVTAAAFSPAAPLVVTAGKDRTARLWNAATGEARGVLTHPDEVLAVAFSPDGRTVLTGCADKLARPWTVETGKVVGPSFLHRGSVLAVAFSPDGRFVLTGSADRTARLWQRSTGKPLGPPWQHPSAVLQVTFSPREEKGWTVLTRSQDRTAWLWRVPAPLAEDAERLALRIQVLTRRELDADGVVRQLDSKDWEQRRQRLQDLGDVSWP
jgi:WD40 repeat protein/serine/threonine protein kinase